MATLTNEDIKSVVLGAAIGDAFGVPFEFLSPAAVNTYSLDIMHGSDCEPVTSPWGDSIPVGTWSDDNSMSIATMESIIAKEGEVDLHDIMDHFVSWVDDSKYCPLDYVFDVGQTVLHAIRRFHNGVPAMKCGGNRFNDNGNGSLMRIFPIILFSYAQGLERRERYKMTCMASSITHSHPISQFSCVFFDELLHQILTGEPVDYALEKAQGLPYEKYLPEGDWSEALKTHSRVLDSDFTSIKPAEINSSGYVLDTLEIVIYSLLNSDSYAETIKKTIRFGNDTDTYATIAGAAAGAIYGLKDIPQHWLSTLKKREYLEDISDRFAKAIA